MNRPFEVAVYNPEWPRMYSAAEKELESSLGNELLELHHIGSTAVRGMSAKPVIDMLGIAQNPETADHWNDSLEKLGYTPLGEYGIKGRRFFYRETDGKRSHHLHIFDKGNPEIRRHLQFRDSLKSNPGVARYYSRLKESLAARYPNDIESYIKGKKEFIDNIIKDNP